GKKEEQIFLGREIAQHRDYSEDTAIKIDQEVRRLVDTAYKTALDIVTSRREYLDKIAHALLEREVIDANDIKAILEGKELPSRVPPTTPPDDGVQQVLKPEPGRAPSVQPGERPAQA
ncbi:MAG: cell division protein FtsH, partial [Terriglobales bacterium]